MAHHTMFSHYSNMRPMTAEEAERAYPREVHEIASQAEVTELRTRLASLEAKVQPPKLQQCGFSADDLELEWATDRSNGCYPRSAIDMMLEKHCEELGEDKGAGQLMRLAATPELGNVRAQHFAALQSRRPELAARFLFDMMRRYEDAIRLNDRTRCDRRGDTAAVEQVKKRLAALETRLITEVAALCESVRELKASVTELGADIETEASRGRYERSQRKVGR